jgi:hypothetical protein
LDEQDMSEEELRVLRTLEDYGAGRVKQGSAEDLIKELRLDEESESE